MSLGDRSPRFAHGSRVPGWDDAVDPAKDPARVPDPGDDEVPAELRAEIEAHMAKYPDRRSAAIPALAAAQRLHGWCSPRGDRAGRRGHAADARLPRRGRHLLRHARHAARRPPPRLRLHEHLVLAARRRRAARGDRARGGRGPRRQRPRTSSASAPATSRRWPASTASTSGRSSSRRCRSSRSRSARARPRCRTSRSCAGRAPIRRPTRASPPAEPARAAGRAGRAIPVRPPEQGTYGEQMPGDQPGPSAPLEDR